MDMVLFGRRKYQENPDKSSALASKTIMLLTSIQIFQRSDILS
uniref:Uncharacterized protein n=1 Tax=Anguilla anguilla TaxID=7936 RepID=A0A0E9VNC5_ANGAN